MKKRILLFPTLQYTFPFDCVVKLPSWFFDLVAGCFFLYLWLFLWLCLFPLAQCLPSSYWNKKKRVQVCDFSSLIFKWLWTAFWFVFIRRKVFCDSFFLLFWSLPRIEFIPSLFVLMLSIFFWLLCVSLIKCDAILFPVCRFTFVDSPRSIFGCFVVCSAPKIFSIETKGFTLPKTVRS